MMLSIHQLTNTDKLIMTRIYFLLLLSFVSISGLFAQTNLVDDYGAIIRKDTEKKVIHFIFSADNAFEGAPLILKALDKHKAKGSFFLTGNCLRNKQHTAIIKKIIKKGHYVGGHSDNHLLYAPWDSRHTMLVTKDSLVTDFKKNMAELEKFGIDVSKVIYYLPPFEYYNKTSVDWIKELGVESINYTAGIRTPADYTIPGMKNYKSSQELIDQLFEFEREKGLNGAIILLHPGTQNERTDKLYLHLDSIMSRLEKLGYSFDKF